MYGFPEIFYDYELNVGLSKTKVKIPDIGFVSIKIFKESSKVTRWPGFLETEEF